MMKKEREPAVKAHVSHLNSELIMQAESDVLEVPQKRKGGDKANN